MIIVSFYIQFKTILIIVMMYRVNNSDLHYEVFVYKTLLCFCIVNLLHDLTRNVSVHKYRLIQKFLCTHMS
jgi:hypothetical protein